MNIGKRPITKRALIQRINRALVKQGQVLRTARGAMEAYNLGDYYIVDTEGANVVFINCNLEGLGRELKILGDWEVLGE